MSLPILHASNQPTPQTLVRYFLHTERRWSEHVANGVQLDVGTAFANSSLSKVQDANRILDVSLPPQVTPAEAFEIVERHFAERGSRCAQWLMNPSSEARQIEPMIAHLVSRNYRAVPQDVLLLSHAAVAAAIDAPSSIKIIPTRASFRHARELFASWADSGDADRARQSIDSALAHLDDPHYDALMALQNGTAIGHAGVYAAGETGRIEDVYVAPADRRRGIGRLLMSRVLEICGRSLFKHVMVACAPENVAAQRLYANMGFEKIGEIAAYAPAEA